MSESGPHRPESRVRVTGPPRHVVRDRARAADIDEETELGAVLMGSLIRAQLRLALLTTLPLVALAAGLPLAARLAPGPAAVRLLGVPIAWWVLGVLVYPCCYLLGWLFVRRAERHERHFADLVSGADAPRREPR